MVRISSRLTTEIGLGFGIASVVEEIILMSKNVALLVIDVQKSFTKRPFWTEDETTLFRENLLKLIDGSMARSVLPVAIYHVDEKSPDSPFNPASGLVEPMDWLNYKPAVTFHKSVHNSFTDTGLDRWLRGHDVKRVIICGMRTEQCCETTARVASDLGYEVDFVSDATLTFAMTHAGSGRTYTPAEIRERSELVLADRFAKIRSVASVLESLS